MDDGWDGSGIVRGPADEVALDGTEFGRGLGEVLDGKPSSRLHLPLFPPLSVCLFLHGTRRLGVPEGARTYILIPLLQVHAAVHRSREDTYSHYDFGQLLCPL